MEVSGMEPKSPLPLQPVFHAVYVPLENNLTAGDGSQLHVYCNKVEALEIIKTHKKGRLKTFKTLEEAQEFARNGLEAVLVNPFANSIPTITVSEEKTSNFKTLKPQNLTSFRKIIEKGHLDTVKSIIWDNPRYLISDGDTPAILHEGCRYNALHTAVKVTQSAEMCELILNTVGNPEFIKLLYGDSEETRSYVNRASILQDLYLNTPDRGLNETPLHFATKFGLKDCVKTLLSYPQCLKTPLNKYKNTPAEIICCRKSIDDTVLIQEIRSLLEEHYYVPVLRAEDNSLQPIIGEPFSPNSPPELNNDPISPRIEVKAFAGPMSKAQAVEFRKKWKTPPRILGTPNKKTNISDDCNELSSPCLNLSLRLQDTEKGLERVGRELASEYHVAWKEYWPFLQDFADLRCNEGLDKLEEFLRTKLLKANTFLIMEKTFINHLEEKNTTDGIDEICNQLKSLLSENKSTPSNKEEQDEDDVEFVTPPSSPSQSIYDDSESSDEENMDLANDNITDEIFLEGKVPSKIDFAVYNAIPIMIDVNKYPFTYRWRHEMQLASKNVSNINITRSSQKHTFKKRLFHSDIK